MNRQIAKNTLLLYIRMFLTMGVSLYTSRVVLDVLGIEDYGIYTVVGGVVAMFGFFNAAMSSATQRFLAICIGKKDWAGLKKTFNATFLIHLGIAILLLLFAETLGLWFVNNKLNLPSGRIEVVNFVYQFSIFASIIAITQVPFNALIIAREQMSVFAIISIVEVLLKLLIVYLLLASPFDKLKTYSLLTLVVAVVISTVYKLYCHKKYEESKFAVCKEKELYKSLLSYSGWSLFGNVAAIARGQGINIILNLFFGTLVNAAYGIMTQVQTAVSTFVLNFQTAVNPQIYKTYAKGNKPEMFRIMFYSSKISFYMMLVIVCPIIYNVDFLLKFWLKTPPPYSNIFIVYNLAYLLIDTISNPLMIGVQASGKIKWYQIILGPFIFLNLPVSYFLFKLYPYPEVFLYVLVAITFLSLVFRLIYLKRLLGFPSVEYIRKVLFPISLVSIAIIFCMCFINYDTKSIFELLFTSLAIILTSGLFIWIFGLGSKEKKIILKIINEKILKKTYNNPIRF